MTPIMVEGAETLSKVLMGMADSNHPVNILKYDRTTPTFNRLS